jgi:twitching motility protein PilT
MLESIGSLLGILHTQKGKELRLEVGKRASLHTASGVFEISQTPLSQADIGGAIMPLIPEKVRSLLPTQPEVDFAYDCSGIGNFAVKIKRLPTGIFVSFTPQINGSAASGNGYAASGQTGALPGRPAPTSAPMRQTGNLSQTSNAYSAPQPSSPSAQPAPTGYAPAQPSSPSAPPAQSSTNTSGSARTSLPFKIDDLFRAQVAMGASDLHISTSMPPMVRKDGAMMNLNASYAPLDPEASSQLLSPIIPQKNREEFGRRHDTDFAYEIADLARFRANIFRDRKGMGGVFRVIPNEILTAEKLGLSQAILKLCHLNKGLVLVTGPTGSGKSTTLCAMIDYINRQRADHIITIEDPIEFVHENKKCLINQREVHNHTDSFKDALRAALREDPDIILVGEMRDLETVAIAIETAETGHLVLGTLHTTTAPSTVDRIIDQFPPDRQTQIRIMLSESLKGVISQTLLRKTGGGRVAALEVLISNAAMSNLIREGKTFQIPSMMQTGRANGNLLLNDSLIELVKSKTVAPDEAYAKSIDKTGFETLLKRNSFDTSFTLTTT